MFTYGEDSYHGFEIHFVFRNNDTKVSETVSQTWMNFTKDGAPLAPGLPEWETYTRADVATMLPDEESMLVHGHDRNLMALLESDYTY